MKPDRVPCCVPHCGRTCRKGEYIEFLCSKHWPLVSPFLRGEKFATERVWRRLFAGLDPDEMSHDRKAQRDRAYNSMTAAWAACKRAAIERAGGL